MLSPTHLFFKVLYRLLCALSVVNAVKLSFAINYDVSVLRTPFCAASFVFILLAVSEYFKGGIRLHSVF